MGGVVCYKYRLTFIVRAQIPSVLNPYSSDKQKQEHKNLCSLWGDGNSHLTRLKRSRIYCISVLASS